MIPLKASFRVLSLSLMLPSAMLLSAPVQAAPLTAGQVLNQFNAVVLGNLNSNSQHIDGRAYVGGSMSGGEVAGHPNDMPASTYAGLTVMGSATNVKAQNGGAVIAGSLTNSTVNSGTTVVGGAVTGSTLKGVASISGSATGTTLNSGGEVKGNMSGGSSNGVTAIGGSVSGGTNLNGSTTYVQGSVDGSNVGGNYRVVGGITNGNRNGTENMTLTKPNVMTSTMQANLDASTSTNFQSVLDNLSDQLKTVASTGSTVTYNGNKAIFNAVVNANGLAVFDLTAIDTVLFGKSEFEFNLNGATSVLLNTDITTASINANFLGGSAPNYGSKLLWNFYNATSLTIGSQFGGSILATDAFLTNNQNIEGGVFVSSLQQNAEIHLQPFNGYLPLQSGSTVVPVPEPAGIALVLTGLGLIGFMRRRRDTSAAATAAAA